jgi:DNA-binding NarL/FixJ family response regulator
MKALLIDDHPLILSGLQIIIKGFGDDVSVACVETARGARELLAEDASYDIVLLDLQLGDCSGFELLEELRSNYPSLSVVVVSSSDSNDDVSGRSTWARWASFPSAPAMKPCSRR